jgi:hypothetical protein
MGAWGTGVFDNDTACDWADELEESDDLSVLEEALELVLSAGADYIEAPDAEQALAAADVIARLQGNAGDSGAYTEAVDAWVSGNKFKVPPVLAKKALAAIERILVEPSELLELWSESEEFGAWMSGIENLRSRIGTS